MIRLTVHLEDKRVIAKDTMSFILSRPEGFLFKPGQHIDLIIPNPPENDGEGNIRTLSLANAPEEEELLVAMRMRDTAFKRVLKSLPESSELEIEGPYGNMILQANTARPAVFLAGGIGITPFRSMIVEAALLHLPHKIFLFYSNRKIEDAAFLEELRGLESKNGNFKLVATFTAPDQKTSDTHEETGYITKEMIKKYIPDLLSPIYYLAGPPAMTSAMHAMLTKGGVSEDDIRMEEFSGY